MKTLILDNYDSFTYNIFQYCAELSANPQVRCNDEITLKQISDEKYTHIIISPGPGSPEKQKDFGICAKAIKKFAGKIPILGICLGHQGISYVFGGKIKHAPEPVHGKRSKIALSAKSRLFRGLPAKIEAMRYHSLICDSKNLPRNFLPTAKTKSGIIMAIEHRIFPLFGVQFHPESIGTPYGKKILKNFLQIAAT